MNTFLSQSDDRRFAFMPQGGATGALVREIAWEKTTLGSPDLWPATLKTALGIVFGSNHPMFVFWGEDHIQFYNDAYRPSFGEGKHPEAMGQRGTDCWPEIWSIIGPQVEQVMSGGPSTWFENQLLPIFRNGRLEDVYWTYGYSPILKPDGTPGGVLVVCTETTGSVVATRALAAEREQIYSLFMQTPMPICILEGPEHRFTLANDQYINYCGKNPVGKKLLEAFTLEEVGPFVSLLDDVYRTGKPFIGTEMHAPLRMADGQIVNRFFNISYHPTRSSVGTVLGVIAIIQDVSANIEGRKKTAESEVQFGLLANSIPQLAWMAHSDGYIHWYNQNWFDFTGTTPAQMEGWGWKVVHDPKHLDNVLSKWNAAIASGEPFEMEFPLRSKGGSFRWFLTRAAPVRNEKGELTGWIGSNTDIDEQKKSIRDLEEQRELREKFVYALTHDLRTPMTAGKMTAQLILRRPSDPAQVAKLAERIIVNMDRADDMIRDLLDVSRIRAGEPLPLTYTECRLRDIIETSVADLALTHGSRIRMENEFGELVGSWDANIIQRIVENLVGNAVKYGTPDTPITVRLDETAEWVEIGVHNDGNPIADVDQVSLFDPFRRTKDALGGGLRGWGIGLTLVKGMTEALGGMVRVESSVAQGTTFFVRLPRDSRKVPV